MSEEKITQWFINNVNGTPSEEQLVLRKVYEQSQEIERLNNILDGYEKEMDNLINARDKAIEYIEQHKNIMGFYEEIDGNKLLEILKGEK